jgi:hypothetical protein
MFTRLIAVVVIATATTAVYPASIAQLEKDRQQAEIAELVAAENYGAISRRATQALAGEARFADGMWRLSLLYANFFSAMESQISDDEGWNRAFILIRREAQASPMAWLLYEQALSARAWSVRGSGYASEVSPDAMRAFRKYLLQGKGILDKHKGQLAINPAWFSMRLTLSLELDEDESYAKGLSTKGEKNIQAITPSTFPV